MVVWEALPQSLSSESNLGCLHMSKPLFCFTWIFMGLRMHRKELLCRQEQLQGTDRILWVHSMGQYKKHTWSRWPLSIQAQTQMVLSLQSMRNAFCAGVSVSSCRLLPGGQNGAPGEGLWLCTNPSHHEGHRELWQESFLNAINQFIGQHINPWGAVKWGILKWDLSQLYSGLWFLVCRFFSPTDGFFFHEVHWFPFELTVISLL